MVTETERQPVPYAPVNNVLTVIRRLRDHGLPEILSLGELQRIGIPDGNAPRTLAALRFLGLVDEDGRRTPAFDRLGLARSDEYNETLAEIVRDAYSKVFAVVNPAQSTEIDVADAFRGFEPARQRNRMITLFMGVCREAGIVSSGPEPEIRPRRRQQRQDQGERRERQVRAIPSQDDEQHAPPPTGLDLQLLSGLIQQLPKDGRWTKPQRDRWLQAVAANIDVLVEVEDEEARE